MNDQEVMERFAREMAIKDARIRDLERQLGEMTGLLAQEQDRHDFTIVKWMRERKELTDELVQYRGGMPCGPHARR